MLIIAPSIIALALIILFRASVFIITCIPVLLFILLPFLTL